MAIAGKPHKLPYQQLLILSIIRFAEPVALTSVFPYLPEMIETFNVPKDAVSKWAGIISAVFSLSQAATGIAWGRASDRFGRKPAILCAMFSVMCASLLFGFSRSLVWAIVARCLAGASNGNVGIIRTTVAEMVPYKELQPKAFSVMPLVWTIGSIFGPGFGGALAKPAAIYPRIFGQSKFLKDYPFALPNIVASVLFLIGLTTGFLFLHETLETKRHQRDRGRALGQLLFRPCRREKLKPKWPLKEDQASPLLKHSRRSSISSTEIGYQDNNKTIPPDPPTYREVFSRQSNLNLLTYSLLALHSTSYDQLLPIYMHYPRQLDRASNSNVQLPFKFTGGFGIDSDRIGLLFTAYGIVGMFIQFFAFPTLARRYGILPCLKVVTAMFPIVYLITPFTALFPSVLSQQIAMFCIMVIKCWAVIFSFPCTTVLLTNSAVSLRVLGTLNGVATSLSALGRAAGPAIGGWTFSLGVTSGFGILPWWTLAGFALLGAISPWWLVEMDGFGDAYHSDSEDGDLEGQEIIHVGDNEQDSSQPVDIGGGPLAENGEDTDGFSLEVDAPVGPHRLSKTSSHSTGSAGSGVPRGRI
ncbi:hypothetical protein MMC28_004752 [Mycoblastus sanguinarius]|nr:hypothetical protein [Mycoblastus sanguinarius]